MKRVVLFFICFLFSITLVNAEDWEKVRKDIESLNEKIEKAIVAGDMSLMTTYYTDDVTSLPSFEPAIKGKESLLAKAKKDMEAGMKVTAADFKTTEFFGSGDIAVEIGEWDMSFTMPGSDTPISDTGKYVTVWQKQDDGSWKTRVETWNTSAYPAEMPGGEMGAE